MENKGLTLNGITAQNAFYTLISVIMIGISIYLTSHYYDTIYPTSLGGGSTICNISSFFNCDAATYSSIAAIAGVPISFFGVLIGLIFLGSVIFPSAHFEKTASAISKYNLIGCVVLFVYSLAVLGSLCPLCSGYYILSAIACFLLWKKGLNSWTPDPKVGTIWVAIFLFGGGVFNRVTAAKQEKQLNIASQITTQFNALAVYGDPETESPYKLHISSKTFAESPIRVSIFSDFQCPFCQKVAEQTHQLIRLYGDKISVQYFFYPLDSSCNAKMKSPVHPIACRAAMLAACDADKFSTVHDEIFAAQEGMTLDSLKGIAETHGLTECFNSQSSKDAVLASMNQAEKFNLTSTPTIIINGRKIEGSIPNPQFQAIFDEILKKGQ